MTTPSITVATSEYVVTAKDLHQRTEIAKSRSESALEEKVETALGHLFADHIRPASEKGEFKITTRLGASTEVETILVQRLTDLGFAVIVAEPQPGSRDGDDPGHLISWERPKPAKAKAAKVKKTRDPDDNHDVK